MMDELEHPLTLAELAAAVDGTVEGDASLLVRRAVHLADASQPTDLALAMGPAFVAQLAASGATMAIVLEGAELPPTIKACIRVKRMQNALAALTGLLDRPRWHMNGIHPSAVIDPRAAIDPSAQIGPCCVVGPHVTVGAGTILYSQATVGAGATVGAHCQLHAGVRIGDGCRIGDRTIIHPNAVIGADGFSFVPPGRGAVEAAKAGANQVEQAKARYLRIASLGPVIIGADCEIGACTTIDRATLRTTTVGDGTKIDNLVQIGHNGTIGEDVLICGQVGLAGSVLIGDRAVLGGRSGVADQIKIGEGAIVAAASGVGTNVPPGAVFMGYPAQARDKEVSQMMATRRLPRLLGRLEALEGRLKALETLEATAEND